jgi:hypothetical protein
VLEVVPKKIGEIAISREPPTIVASQPGKDESEFSARGDFVVDGAGQPLDSGGSSLYPIMRIYA